MDRRRRRATTATTSTRPASRSRRSTRRPTRTRSPSSSATRACDTWGVKRIFRGGASGSGPPPAPDCASTFVKSEPTDDVFGVWMGTPSAAQRRPAVVARPRDARTSTSRRASARSRPAGPRRSSSRATRSRRSRAACPFDATSTADDRDVPGRARSRRRGGLPLGTELYLTIDRFDVVAGRPVPRDGARPRRARTGPSPRPGRAVASGRLDVATGDGEPRRRRGGSEATTTFTVTPSGVGRRGPRSLLGATLTAKARPARPTSPVRVVPAVAGHGAAAARRSRSSRRGRATPACRSSAASSSPCCRSASARPARCGVDLHNWSGAAQSGSVSLTAADRLHGDARVAAVLRASPPAGDRRSPST